VKNGNKCVKSFSHREKPMSTSWLATGCGTTTPDGGDEMSRRRRQDLHSPPTACLVWSHEGRLDVTERSRRSIVARSAGSFACR
jgi:hypothetical protein